MREQLQASIRANQIATKPDEKKNEEEEGPVSWTALNRFLQPVCANLKISIDQVIDLVFTVLSSGRSAEALQSEVSVRSFCVIFDCRRLCVCGSYAQVPRFYHSMWTS